MLSRLTRRTASAHCRPAHQRKNPSTTRSPFRRPLVTLAIETSCDDTSVAVAELRPPSESIRLKVHFHEKITANNDAFSGIHPLVALQSHQSSLAPLVERALLTSPKPDLVAATRGPGMRSNLAVGLDTAKGLALAWKVPFVGVHHMQAHALTPRLVAAMRPDGFRHNEPAPCFPFLSVLASGGHTILINSETLVEHTILAETHDIALGDCLDKAARVIVPSDSIKMPYGKALEDFAFPRGHLDFEYTPPARRREELERRSTKWGWSLGPPLSESKGGDKSSRRMVYSFAGLLSSVERFMRHPIDPEGLHTRELRPVEDITLEERRDMAREVQRVAFEHLASRIMLRLSVKEHPAVKTVVVSGGVASNTYLRHVLRSILDVRGFEQIALEFPPIHLCTDNALMIAWTAMEMWQAGYRSSLDVTPIRKWSMDPAAADGGILGAGGWERR